MRVIIKKPNDGHVEITMQSNRLPPVPPVVETGVHVHEVAKRCRKMLGRIQAKRVELTLPGL